MADDKDFRPFGVNLSTAGRFGGAGILGGSSAAAALVLVKLLKDLSDERKALTEVPEEEKNTIMLTLPKRAQAVEPLEHELAAAVAPTKPRKTPNSDRSEDNKRTNQSVKVRADHPRQGTKAMTTPKQIRSTDGKYNVKTANWQTLATSLLALGAGGSLGYNLVNKVYDIKRQRELEGKLTSAKQEYLDMLGSTSKMGAVKAAGLFGGTRKGDPSFSWMDYPGGLAAVALLLGGGSTAWLTKKLLDEYNKDPENKFKPTPAPHIDRIVFRSADADDAQAELPSMRIASGEKDASAQDVMEASLGIYLDLMSGKADILGDVKCGAELIAAGTDPEGMYKMASEDYDRLVMYLKENPGLRSTVKRLAMEKHPILKYFKWTTDLPLIKAYGDSKLYGKLDRNFGPTSDVWGSIRKGETPEMMESKNGSVKAGSIPGLLGGTIAGTGGSIAAQMAFDKSRRREPLEAAPAALTPEEQKAKVEQIVQNIQLGAKDPKALAYVQQNGEKIRNILLILAQEGKI